MQKRGDSLLINLSSLATGSYTYEIMIYSKKASDNTSRQYYVQKNFTLPLQQRLVQNAPTGTYHDTWLKRAVFFAPNNEALAIVGMDPRDGFYEVRFREAAWSSISLQRYSVDVNVLVALKEYNKNLPDALLGIAEMFAFDTYVQTMNGKNWTKAYISVSLKHQSGRTVEFDYQYNKN
jgi:hypothetical protein